MDKKPYRSCYYLESAVVFFPEEITFCCDRQSPESMTPIGTVEETVEAFLKMREHTIQENQGDCPPCAGCPLFQEYDMGDGKIQWISLSTYSYCQFSCIYCNWQLNHKQDKNKPEHYDSIAICKELKHRGLLSDQLSVSCAPGEISIHPRKDEYFDFIEENACTVQFVSNAGKYDERIAEILGKNAQNRLYVSLDCGTKETFLRVRGIDMFEQVIDNLAKYREKHATIILKYILLQENCNILDLMGFIQICKNLRISQIQISEDFTKEWNRKPLQKPEEYIVDSAIFLAKQALKNQIPFSFVEGFGQTNLSEIHRKLCQEPEFLAIEKSLDRILSAEKVICYGAGGNLENIICQLSSLGLRKPDALWDIKASNSYKERLGYPMFYPDFESLNSSSDVGMLITITNGVVNQDLLASMQKFGFTNAISYDRLALALMAKQVRKAIEKADF